MIVGSVHACKCNDILMTQHCAGEWGLIKSFNNTACHNHFCGAVNESSDWS